MEKKKNWFLKHWFISIFLGLILFGIISNVMTNLSGNDNSASETNGLPEENSILTYSVGESFIIEPFRYTINSVETQSQLTSVFGIEEAQGVFLIVDFTLENVGNEAEYANDELYVIDSQNREFESDYEYSLYVDNYFSSIDKINPGISETGQLVFQVPTDIGGKIGIKKSMFSSKFSAFVQW